MKEKSIMDDFTTRQKEIETKNDKDNNTLMTIVNKYADSKSSTKLKPAKKYKKGYFF